MWGRGRVEPRVLSWVWQGCPPRHGASLPVSLSLPSARDAATHPHSRSDPTAGPTPHQPRGHGASLAPHFELALLFPRQEEAGSWHSGWAALPPDTPVRSQQCFNSRDLALSARLPASFSMSNDTNVLLALSPALGCSPGCSQAPLSLPCLCFTSEQLPSVCLSPFSPPTQLPDGVKWPKGEANQADRL